MVKLSRSRRDAGEVVVVPYSVDDVLIVGFETETVVLAGSSLILRTPHLFTYLEQDVLRNVVLAVSFKRLDDRSRSIRAMRRSSAIRATGGMYECARGFFRSRRIGSSIRASMTADCPPRGGSFGQDV
jgi:hypothetical protein